MGIADLLDQLDIKEPLPSYSPTLYRITSGKGEAVALAQLIYKCSKSGWGTVRMSSSDWANELGITRNEFENLNDCINLLELGTAIKCQIGTIKKIAYTLNEEAIKEALKNPHVEYSICRKQRINTLNSTYQHDENNVSTRTEQRINTFETTHIKEIKSNKSNEEIKEPLNEASSFGAFGLKTDFMQKAAEEAIQRGEPAKTKAKKPKEPTDELTSEIHKYTCQAHDYFKQWYEDKYQTSLVTWDKDFVNIKKTFRKLIDGSANLEEKKRLTPERCFLGVKYIIENFDKLHISKQNKLSLNYIATNWNELIPSIKNFQAPVERKNFNEPVKTVHTKLPAYYNGYALPMGITTMQFEKLGELVYRDKIMDGLIDESFMSVYEFLEKYRGELKKITAEQLNQLMKDYEIV
jgi:hypothetical protein